MKTQSSSIRVAGLFFILFCQSVWGQITWSDAVRIAAGSSPDFTLDRKTGKLHIVTKKQGITYTVMDSTGKILSQELISESIYDNKTWDAGATIAVDAYSNPHVCFRRQTTTYPNWKYDIYYIYKQNNRWSNPYATKIAEDTWRGYNVRMAIDQNDYVHIVYGERSDATSAWGPWTYTKIRYGAVRYVQTDIATDYYRTDSSLEIDVDRQNQVHVVLGCPGLKTNTSEGIITYYRGAPGQNGLTYIGRLDHGTGRGRTSNPDIFSDQAGFLHVSYGDNADGTAGGNPSVHYVRYHDNQVERNTVVTQSRDISAYTGGSIWAVSTVAATDDGQGVVVAYRADDPRNKGNLKAAMSPDSGKTWTRPVTLSSTCDGEEGRSRAVIRAFRDHFYLVYPDSGDGWVKLRVLWNGGDGRPVAVINPAYSGQEGSPVQFDASQSYDIGQSPKIVEYAWDWDNDGFTDDVTSVPRATHVYPDDFSGSLSLIVRDKWGQADTALAAVRIANVSPTAAIGSDRTINEGDTLAFQAVVTDPGQDVHAVNFRIDAGVWLAGNPMIHVFEDDGEYTVIVHVTDDDGGVGYDTLTVHVANVSPSVVAEVPKAGSTNMELQFSGAATDPGINDVLSYEWDLNNDHVWENTGRTATASFAVEGVYPIHLRVSDDDGGTGYDTHTLRIIDAPPEVASIPDQIFDEGAVLPPIMLDDFVTDPVVEPDRLTWQVSGQAALIVTLQDRVLTVAAPDSEWSGQETLTLVCANHIALKDTDAVTYTIRSVNDPPRWNSPVPDFSIPEDDSLIVLYSDLLALVGDPDHEKSQLRFQVSENPFVKVRTQAGAGGIRLVPVTDWAGKTELIFFVADPEGGVATGTSEITVVGTPDEPDPFSLIDPMYVKSDGYPDTILFVWHSSYDPDAPGSITYEWTLEHQGGLPTSPVIKRIVQDTLFTFILPSGFMDGTYFWWATANSQAGGSRKSENLGFVVIGDPSSVPTEPMEILPDEFALFQNYPNPFNPVTRIEYHLAQDCTVHLAIYNPLGQCVRILDQGRKTRGAYSLVWNGRDESGHPVRSGIYIYRLKAGERLFEKKMLLLQ